MLQIVVRVEQVDHNGFCGRENHPTQDMVGMLASVYKIEHWCENGEDVLDINDTSQNHGDYPFTALYAMLSDGRMVELMEHEISVVKFRLNAAFDEFLVDVR